ncbi:hypothetical protein [Lysobacter gummosus]
MLLFRIAMNFAPGRPKSIGTEAPPTTDLAVQQGPCGRRAP